MRLVVVRSWTEGRTGSDCSMGMGFPSGAMKIFGSLMEAVVEQHCERAERHWIVYFQMANFLFREFTSIEKMMGLLHSTMDSRRASAALGGLDVPGSLHPWHTPTWVSMLTLTPFRGRNTIYVSQGIFLVRRKAGSYSPSSESLHCVGPVYCQQTSPFQPSWCLVSYTSNSCLVEVLFPQCIHPRHAYISWRGQAEMAQNGRKCTKKEGLVAGFWKGQNGDGTESGRGWELWSEAKSLWAISKETRLLGWGGVICRRRSVCVVQFWRCRYIMARSAESLWLHSAQPEQLYRVISWVKINSLDRLA